MKVYQDSKLWMRVFVLATSVMAIGCGGEVRRDKLLFNIDSLLNAQVALLGKTGAQGIKQATVDGKRDSAVVSGSQQWQVELEVFRELDMINRPANREQYEMKVSVIDSLKTVSYEPRDGGKKLITLKVIYGPGNSLRRIEAAHENQTAIFSTHSSMYLAFADHKGASLLSAYRLSGSQHLLLGDSVAYILEGTVVVPDKE